MTPRTLPALLAVAAVAAVAAALVTTVAPARAQATECDGKPATIIGPTSGANTVGTDGDDVIVAPIASYGTISGGDGNDTICLVGVSTIPAPGDIYGFTVNAGGGNDTVLNQTTETAPNGHVAVQLGSGADRYVGADYGESVYGSVSSDAQAPDTEVDVIETRGGDDGIVSGTDIPGYANNDVISTGAGRDYITYGGLAGAAIDNGPDADSFRLAPRWAGNVALDNVTRRATIDGLPALTWTAMDTFDFRVTPGNSLSFAGNDNAETLNISGSNLDLSAPTATITMGGGDDALKLENYLPASVDMGVGTDRLDWTGCRTATIALDRGVTCRTDVRANLGIGLTGVDHLRARSGVSLTVLGTPRDDVIDASARLVGVFTGDGADEVGARAQEVVTVRTGPGADEVRGRAREILVAGGPGADWLAAIGPRNIGAVVRGGGGADVVKGAWGPDRLYGGRGKDTAYGQKNDDLCQAEVRHGCERH